jgi:hemolysin III
VKSATEVKYYPPLEEKLNIASHAIGFFLSIAALALLATYASLEGTVWHIVSFSIYGASLIILFGASTIYHSVKKPELRSKLRIFDHASIYVLIAGSYTPFTLITLNGLVGWVIFSAAWGMALIGIVLKLFFTGRYKLVSTLMYVFMGWLIIFAIKPLANNLQPEALNWLIAGGVAYTVGAVLYSIKKIKFNHAIFHIFVLFGASCHFIAVFFYLLPGD